MEQKEQTRIAGYLGLAQRAGKIVAGDTPVKEALGKKQVSLLVVAEDAADSVKNELIGLAGSQIPVLYWPDKIDLGRIVGKSRRGAIALLDPGFTKAILNVIQNG